MGFNNEEERLNLSIKMTTATELCQIEGSIDGKDTKDKMSVVVFKTQKVLAENSFGEKKPATVPYFSGNGFRGKMRRIGFGILFRKAIEKGYPLPDRHNYHIMENGGSNIYHSQQRYDVIDEIRELNPLVSVFGASLFIPSKLVTPNYIPYKRVVDGEKPEYYLVEREDGSLVSYIKGNETFVKEDTLADNRGNAKYMSKEERDAWLEEVAENQANVSKTRNNEDGERAKKITVKSRLSRNYVIRGVDYYSALTETPTEKMNGIERGLVYRIVEEFVVGRFGGNIAKGFGLVDFSIKGINENDNTIIETLIDHRLVPTFASKIWSEQAQKDIALFDEWLENDFSEESFRLSEKLKKISKFQ